MTAYIKTSTLEYPRHEGDIRLEYPDMGEEFVCPDTYSLVHPTERPAMNARLQKLSEGAPELRDGKWYATWVLENKTPEEIAEFDAEKPVQNTDASGSAPNVIG